MEKQQNEYSMRTGGRIDPNTIYFAASNFSEFKQLIVKAQEQSDELQKTIDKLRYFDFKFEVK